MDLVKYSINSNIINKGDPSVRGWENKETSIEDFIYSVTKKGFAFSPVLIDNHNGKKPSKSDIKGWQVIALDIDNSIGKSKKSNEQGYFSFQEALDNEFIKENAYFLYTTPSYQVEHHKFRIVFVISELLTNIDTYGNVIAHLINIFGADTACKSVERMFFGNVDAKVHLLRKFLDINTLIDNSNQVNEIKTFEKDMIPNSVSDSLVKEMLKYIPKQLEYIEWFSIISAIGNSFDENTACTLVDGWSPSTNPDTRTKLKKRGKDFSIAIVIYHAKKNGWNGIIPANRESQSCLTQVKIADDFAEYLHGKLKYENTSSKWLLWNGKKWDYDNLQKVKNMLIEYIRKNYTKKGNSFQTNYNINSILNLLQSKTKISSIISDFDINNNFINLNNGIYDLINNQLLPHNPEFHLSKIIGIDYLPDEDCPEFKKYLNTVFNNNDELISYVQRALGLSLCGEIKENTLFFCFGNGKNGKSIFFNVIKDIFGEYYCKAPTDMILAKNFDSIPNDIAILPGKRIVIIGEMPENRSLNEERIKDLTGGDLMTARFMRGEYFNFQPTFTMWLYGNHKPNIRGVDEGIWRRVNLIPFNVIIKEEERIPMDILLKKFEIEKAGILNWIIQGWRSYQKNGLMTPSIVTEVTREYRNEQDIINNFINECCYFDPESKKQANMLYQKYKQWCKDYDLNFKSNQIFYKYIENLNGVKLIEERKHKFIEGISYKEDEN